MTLSKKLLLSGLVTILLTTRLTSGFAADENFFGAFPSSEDLGYQQDAVDLDNDGLKEIISIHSGSSSSFEEARIAILTAGQSVETRLSAFFSVGSRVYINYRPSLAAFFDLDGDGQKEIILGAFVSTTTSSGWGTTHRVLALNLINNQIVENPTWPQGGVILVGQGSPDSAPMICYVTTSTGGSGSGSGKPIGTAGTRPTGEPSGGSGGLSGLTGIAQGPQTPGSSTREPFVVLRSHNNIFALSRVGQIRSGFPIAAPAYPYGYTRDIACGDLDGDNDDDLFYTYDANGPTPANSLTFFDVIDFGTLQTLPGFSNRRLDGSDAGQAQLFGAGIVSVGMADIAGSATRELVFTMRGYSASVPLEFRLFAYQSSGQWVAGFPSADAAMQSAQGVRFWADLDLSDVDGNGKSDIHFSGMRNLQPYGYERTFHLFNGTGSIVSGWPIAVTYTNPTFYTPSYVRMTFVNMGIGSIGEKTAVLETRVYYGNPGFFKERIRLFFYRGSANLISDLVVPNFDNPGARDAVARSPLLTDMANDGDLDLVAMATLSTIPVPVQYVSVYQVLDSSLPWIQNPWHRPYAEERNRSSFD